MAGNLEIFVLFVRTALVVYIVYTQKRTRTHRKNDVLKISSEASDLIYIYIYDTYNIQKPRCDNLNCKFLLYQKVLRFFQKTFLRII